MTGRGHHRAFMPVSFVLAGADDVAVRAVSAGARQRGGRGADDEGQGHATARVMDLGLMAAPDRLDRHPVLHLVEQVQPPRLGVDARA